VKATGAGAVGAATDALDHTRATSQKDGAAVTAHTIEILPAERSGTLSIHGMDDETKTLLGFLARYTGRTLENYEMDLRQFQAWAHGMGLLRLLDAERFHLELYVRHLVERGLAASTVSRMFGTVRGLFHYAHVDGVIAKDPAAYVKSSPAATSRRSSTGSAA
jgi:hypothetical protein